MTFCASAPDEPARAPADTRERRTLSPWPGAALWLLSAQFFVVEVTVAAAWRNPRFSWRSNAISDLGASHCGRFDGRDVCSPLAGLMNGSLIVLGLCMALGSVLLYQSFRRNLAGHSMIVVAGLGAGTVGLFPEDSVFWIHLIGQDAAFLGGGVAMIMIGLSRAVPTMLRRYSLASGSFSLVALTLFLTHHRFSLGLGGMERLVAYPLIIWLLVFGAWALRSRPRTAQETPRPSGPSRRLGNDLATQGERLQP